VGRTSFPVTFSPAKPRRELLVRYILITYFIKRRGGGCVEAGTAVANGKLTSNLIAVGELLTTSYYLTTS